HARPLVQLESEAVAPVPAVPRQAVCVDHPAKGRYQRGGWNSWPRRLAHCGKPGDFSLQDRSLPSGWLSHECGPPSIRPIARQGAASVEEGRRGHGSWPSAICKRCDTPLTNATRLVHCATATAHERLAVALHQVRPEQTVDAAVEDSSERSFVRGQSRRQA